MDQQVITFPEVEPFDSQTLDVGDGHSLYLEQAGNPDGKPAVYLHGGPGSGCQAAHRRLFDPARFRVVLFDQRGAGRSTPKGRLEANTTAHLVADLERIREALGIERWLVVGGSWGSLLALAYAEAWPERVSGLVTRALLLGEAEEIDWAFGKGPRTFRPELWRAYRDLLPEAERDDPLAAYGAERSSAQVVQRWITGYTVDVSQAAELMTLYNIKYLVVHEPIPFRKPYEDTFLLTRILTVQWGV